MLSAARSARLVVGDVTDFRETLCKLSLRDSPSIDRVIADDVANQAASQLDEKTHALVRLGALVAMDAATPSYVHAIGAARSAGASPDEIVGCLIAVLPAAGIARVVSAAPKVGLGLGYDVDDELEAHTTPGEPRG